MISISIPEFKVTDQLVWRVFGAILLGLVVALLSGFLTASQTMAAGAFIVIFSVLGIMSVLQKISISSHPNHVLLGAVAFTFLTAIVNSFLF